MTATPIVGAPPSPYRGLLPFGDSELDALFFFGRERERDVIVANLMASRLTVLYGPSGVGKSSLLRAGVARRLRCIAEDNAAAGEAPGLAAVVFATWTDDPLTQLAAAAMDEVEAVTGTRPSTEAGASLADTLAACADIVGGELYLICDQVEEHFVYAGRNGGPERFVAELADAVNRRDVRAHFLLSIREDELAKLDAFKAALPNVLGNYLRLDRLDRRSAREAIEGPLGERNRLAGEELAVAIEPALLEAVLDEVSVARLGTEPKRANGSSNGAGARIEAPYLQLVMQRLWDAEAEAGSRVLRREMLVALGGAERVVGDHLERALAALSPDEKDAAASMFTYLVTPSGSKVAHAPGDLADYAGVESGRAEGVLRSLAEQRIVRPVDVPGGDGPRYEIFHDVLGETVRVWRSAYVAERRLEDERRTARRRQRRLFLVTAVSLIALAIVGSVAVYALGQRGEAREQARVAKARELTVASQSHLERDPQLSMLLALEAAKLEPTPAVERALRAALIRSRGLGVLRLDAPVVAAALSPDGVRAVTADGRLVASEGLSRWVASAVDRAAFDPEGTRVAIATGRVVRLLDARTGAVQRTFKRDELAAALALDARSLVVSDVRGLEVVPLSGAPSVRFRVRSAATSLAIRGRWMAASSLKAVRTFDVRRQRRLAAFFDRATIRALALSPDGGSVATAASDGGIRTWSTTTGRMTNVVTARASRASAIRYTPDGESLVGGFDDGMAAIWRSEGIRTLGLFIGHDDRVTALDVSRDGRRAVSASFDGTVRVWDTVGEPLLEVQRRLARAPLAVAWRDGAPVPVPVGANDPRRDDRARIVGDDVRLSNGAVLRGAGQGMVSIRFAADGGRVVTSNGLEVVVWDAKRGAPLRRLGHQAPVSDAAFSPDGRWVVVAAPTKVFLWDVGGDAPTTEPVLLLAGHTARVASAIFAPDGETIATASLDRTIRTYRCELCGRLPTLVAAAETRLAQAARRLTPDERATFVLAP